VAEARRLTDSVTFAIAINTASPLAGREKLTNPIEIANQVTSIMTVDKLTAQLNQADYVITPPIDHIDNSDLEAKRTLIELGYQAGLSATDSIIRLIDAQRLGDSIRIGKVTWPEAPSDLARIAAEGLTGRSFSRRELVGKLKLLTESARLFELRTVLYPIQEDSLDRWELNLSSWNQPRAVDLIVDFDGNTIVQSETLRQSMKLDSDYLSSSGVADAVKRVAAHYHSLGHDLASAKVVDLDYESKRLRISVDEGVIARIDVVNNVVTKDWLVRSYFPLSIGQPYSIELADQGLANLYGTDLFDQVTVDLIPSANGVIVQIRVIERKYKQVRLGWRWDDAYQSEEFIELLNDNSFGTGTEFLLHARYGNDRHRYYAQARANRIFSSYLSARLRLGQERLTRTLFDDFGEIRGQREELRSGGSVRLGQQIARLGTFSGTLSFEEIEYRYGSLSGSERFDLSSLTVESLVEDFNRATFPRSGKRLLFQIQLAGDLGGGDADFTKFHAFAEAYFSLGKGLVYHPHIGIGLSRTGLPPSEKFYLGGLHSFAGFRTYQLIGDKVFTSRHELRLGLPWRFYLSARYDMGEVYGSSDEIKLRNLRHGVGFFLSLDSPLGPFTFGYGVADSNNERLYFQAGYDF
jgi:outer membrane protein assembly factor BamA